MSIISDFIEYRKQKKILQLKDTVKDVYISADKNAVNEAVKVLKDFVITNPEKTSELYSEIFADKEMPNKIIEDSAIELIETPKEELFNNQSDKNKKNVKLASVEAITEIDGLNDETVNNVINAVSTSPDIDRAHEIEMIKQLNDPKIQQSKVYNILKRIYSKVDAKTTDYDIVKEIEELRFISGSSNIKDMERKIIAKKIAFNYGNFGTTNLNFLKQIIPVEQMRQLNIADSISYEYTKLSKNNEFLYEFNKHDFLDKLSRIPELGYDLESLIQIMEKEELFEILKKMSKSDAKKTIHTISKTLANREKNISVEDNTPSHDEI